MFLSFITVDDMFKGLKAPIGVLKLYSTVIKLLIVLGKVPIGYIEY